jgi:steroid delta-isomerase-like uncharacterized protein
MFEQNVTRRMSLKIAAVAAGAVFALRRMLGPASAQESSVEEQNLRLERESFAAWNAQDLDRFDKLLADDFGAESDTYPPPVRGREGHRQWVQMTLRGFPDLHLEVEQMIAKGDYVITRWRATGTHRGEFMGLQPTNRHGDVRGCTVAEIKGGRATRNWIYWDTGHLLRQLGVLPS